MALTTPHKERRNEQRCALKRNIWLKELQVILGKKRKQQPLDDLSTLGIGCCHLAGNYLPFRAVDGPAKKKGVAVKDQFQSQQ